MNNKIKHTGIIEQIDGKSCKVRIVQVSACAQCTVASHCNVSEKKEKIVDVFCPDDCGIQYHVGDSVELSIPSKSGFKALLLAFGLPFVLLIFVLIVMTVITHNEVLTAFVSLCSLIPYYILLYFMRDRIRDQISFSIEKL
jgi:positive regulator of sigma E activity